jgi:hypothetical protein
MLYVAKDAVSRNQTTEPGDVTTVILGILLKYLLGG